MSGSKLIPMFPLAILPLPGELVPLHIFEPRYKQLIHEAEETDIGFGIFCTHQANAEKLGSWMKLESIVKRYPGGEMDIVVKCEDIFTLHNLYRNYKNQSYPGGKVFFWHTQMHELPGAKLGELFCDYLNRRNITRHQAFFSIYGIARFLNLDVAERCSFLLLNQSERTRFLIRHLHYQIGLLEAELNSRDVYQWN